MFEIRWIDDSKRYGLFATQQIDRGMRIFHELAVVRDVFRLAEQVRIWNRLNTELSLDGTTRSNIATRTQQILLGMQNLEKNVKTNQKYTTAMEIHRSRIEDGSTVEAYEAGIVHPIPCVPMNLYKQAIGVDVTHPNEDAVSIILQDSLARINTYCRGVVSVRSLDAQPRHLTAWGPHSSLVNHGCRPNAAVSYLADTNPSRAFSENIAVIGLHSLTPIETDEEITIEYTPVFGPFDSRRQQLRRFGIAKCHCCDCDYEEDLSLRPEDEIAQQTLTRLSDIGRALNNVKNELCPSIPGLTPVVTYYHLFHAIKAMSQYEYYGSMLPHLSEIAMERAKHHNDNIRVYWFAHWLIMYSDLANGTDHPHTRLVEQNIEAALSNKVWNEGEKDLLVLCPEYAFSDDDTRLMFMLDHDPSTSNYYPQLTITDGHPVPISFEDNLALVRAKLSQQESQQYEAAALATLTAAAAHVEAEAEADATARERRKEAEERADRAAADLVAEEDEEVARKAKAKRKKREKQTRAKEKKKQKLAEVKKAEQQTDLALAARVVAVRAADSVPALPLPLLPRRTRPAETAATSPTSPPRQPPPSPPPPHHRRFRSSSTPEPATMARFFAGTPLRQPPSVYEDEDCISDSGLEIRFGVGITQRV